MQDNDAIAALLEYDHWCTDQLAANMETLSADDLQRKFPIGWHTLHRTLYHLVAVAEHWTDRSRPQPTALRDGAADADPNTLTVASMRQRYKSAGQQMYANLVALRATPDSAKDADGSFAEIISSTSPRMECTIAPRLSLC